MSVFLSGSPPPHPRSADSAAGTRPAHHPPDQRSRNNRPTRPACTTSTFSSGYRSNTDTPGWCRRTPPAARPPRPPPAPAKPCGGATNPVAACNPSAAVSRPAAGSAPPPPRSLPASSPSRALAPRSGWMTLAPQFGGISGKPRDSAAFRPIEPAKYRRRVLFAFSQPSYVFSNMRLPEMHATNARRREKKTQAYRVISPYQPGYFR